MSKSATVKMTVKKTVTLTGYLPVELFEFSVAGQVVYWPMLARPGRRRWTRQAFDNPYAASIYGNRLAVRFERIYGKNLTCRPLAIDRQVMEARVEPELIPKK